MVEHYTYEENIHVFNNILIQTYQIFYFVHIWSSFSSFRLYIKGHWAQSGLLNAADVFCKRQIDHQHPPYSRNTTMFCYITWNFWQAAAGRGPALTGGSELTGSSRLSTQVTTWWEAAMAGRCRPRAFAHLRWLLSFTSRHSEGEATWDFTETVTKCGYMCTR